MASARRVALHRVSSSGARRVSDGCRAGRSMKERATALPTVRGVPASPSLSLEGKEISSGEEWRTDADGRRTAARAGSEKRAEKVRRAVLAGDVPIWDVGGAEGDEVAAASAGLSKAAPIGSGVSSLFHFTRIMGAGGKIHHYCHDSMYFYPICHSRHSIVLI